MQVSKKFTNDIVSLPSCLVTHCYDLEQYDKAEGLQESLFWSISGRRFEDITLPHKQNLSEQHLKFAWCFFSIESSQFK